MKKLGPKRLKLNVVPIKQHTPYDCGPTCLEMLLRFFKKKEKQCSQEVIGKLCHTKKIKGMTITTMQKCLVYFGIKPTRITAQKYMSPERIIYYLQKYKFPIIADTESHWFLIVGYDNRHILIADPYKGRIIRHPINSKFWEEDVEGYILCKPNGENLKKEKK